MNKNINCILLILSFLVLTCISANAQEKIHLFPDRNHAVSGDTVWFSVVILNGSSGEFSNVIHIQLDDTENRHISKVMVVCNENKGEGFIFIPDSLSTGIYVLKAFSLIQKNTESAIVNQRILAVYNRFDKEVLSMKLPRNNYLKIFESNPHIKIETDKEIYKEGELVNVKVNITKAIAGSLENMFITAGIADPMSEKFNVSWMPSTINKESELPVSLTEKNGNLISGRVSYTGDSGPVTGAVVMLSISGSMPYFDYCITDSAGLFYFYLRNATGTAELVIQAIPRYNEEYKIEIIENTIISDPIPCIIESITNEESSFIDHIIKAAYFNKLFFGYKLTQTAPFSMPEPFKYPFYGEPTKTFSPKLFIDLPDFQEISREILHGVQYRERDKKISIRLIDQGANQLFSEEPLKLLDGIPVFNPRIFTPLGTREINRVDAVLFERYFGDLKFNGVLAVYTNNRSLGWTDSMPGIVHMMYPCIQPPATWNFSNRSKSDFNIPDFNQVLYRESCGSVTTGKEFVFHTSDFTGDIIIRVITVSQDYQVFINNKTIKAE
jgi:hypothetical protein